MAKRSDSKKATVAPNGLEENVFESFFVLAKHWQSDLEFYADEVRFLRRLMDKYSIWLVEEKNIKSAGQMAARLALLEKGRSAVAQNVEIHLKHLVSLIENPFAHDAQANRDKHEALEIGFSDFLKDFRQTKREIFKLTEEVIDSENVQHLLKP